MKATVLKNMYIVSGEGSPVRYEIYKGDTVDVNINVKADARDVLNTPEGMCYLCKYDGEHKYLYIPVQYLDIDYSEKDIDWEQRLYDATIASIPTAYERLVYDTYINISDECIAKDAIDIAKEIIRQLKETKDETV
jgi:hypothetical protein